MSTPDANGWMPIETAPQSGRILVARPIFGSTKHGVVVARWNGRSWRTDDGNFVHSSRLIGWQRLPKPPVTP